MNDTYVNFKENDQIIDDLHQAEKYQQSQNSRFFYSTDRFIDTFDDKKLFDEILQYYPNFSLQEQHDSENRKILIAMLNDTIFIDHILSSFKINIHDFFKFIYRIYPSMFNGLFVKKIQKTIEQKSYTKNIRYSTYKYGKPRKKSRRIKL